MKHQIVIVTYFSMVNGQTKAEAFETKKRQSDALILLPLFYSSSSPFKFLKR